MNEHKPQPTLSTITQVKSGSSWQLHKESNPSDMRVNDFSWMAGATQLKTVPTLHALVPLQTYPSSISWWTSRPLRVVGCINPLSSPPSPPLQSGELTCRWRAWAAMGWAQLPTAAGSSRAQLSPGGSPRQGHRERTPFPWQSWARVPTPPTLQGSCKPGKNSPMRSQRRFLRHRWSGIRWRIW